MKRMSAVFSAQKDLIKKHTRFRPYHQGETGMKMDDDPDEQGLKSCGLLRALTGTFFFLLPSDQYEKNAYGRAEQIPHAVDEAAHDAGRRLDPQDV